MPQGLESHPEINQNPYYIDASNFFSEQTVSRQLPPSWIEPVELVLTRYIAEHVNQQDPQSRTRICQYLTQQASRYPRIFATLKYFNLHEDPEDPMNIMAHVTKYLDERYPSRSNQRNFRLIYQTMQGSIDLSDYRRGNPSSIHIVNLANLNQLHHILPNKEL